MGDIGLEPKHSTYSNDNRLRISPNADRAESGAVAARSDSIDHRLAKLVASWPDLTEAAKVQVMRIMKQDVE